MMVIVAFCATGLVSFLGPACAISTHPLILFVAFDGFGFDYLDRGLTPALQRVKENGSSAQYMYNVFPTVTNPNFFSISTGLYPESHGVLGNAAFNENYTCLSNPEYDYELFHYNDDVTPLWTLNELSGKDRYSGTIKWPSSQFVYRNHKIAHDTRDNGQKSVDRIDEAVRWFLDDEKPANLIFLYFSILDEAGHAYGPDSAQVNDTLREINALVEHLQQSLKTNGLDDKVNTIFLSDHGMVDLPAENVVDFQHFLKEDTYTACGESPVWQIRYKPGFENDVYERLRKAAQDTRSFDVYQRNEIPERWHTRNNKRQADLLLVAKPHYFFADAHYKGDHGYDPDVEMRVRPLFIAYGPAFKSNYTIEPFLNLDLYPLVSTMLNLDAPPVKPNGTTTFIKDILRN